MKNLRRGFNRFCFKNRNKGIPNLMLYIVLGNAVVYFLSMLAQNYTLYDVLCFDRNLILQGQVWRLVTYVFTSFSSSSNILLVAISYLCYYIFSKSIENAWGSFRFTLFYLTGVLLLDVFALCFGGILIYDNGTIWDCSSLYRSMGFYLNMSLFLTYATLYPDACLQIYFIIPVRAWVIILLELAITLYEVIMLSYPIFYFPHNLLPLIPVVNYLLFNGKDVLNIFPRSWRMQTSRKKPSPKTGTIPFSGGPDFKPLPVKEPHYTHRCSVCGKTDVTNPEMEFRYCSRCKGYHCYCENHITNHEHIE